MASGYARRQLHPPPPGRNSSKSDEFISWAGVLAYFKNYVIACVYGQDDETYEKLLLVILRILNKNAKQRLLEMSATTEAADAGETTTEETTAAEGSGETDAGEDVGSGEVDEPVADASAAETESSDGTDARRRRRQAAGGKTAQSGDTGPYTRDDIELITNPDDGAVSIAVRNKEGGAGAAAGEIIIYVSHMPLISVA